MSADLVDAGEELDIPSGQLEVAGDGERVRLRWWPTSSTRKIALFRVVTDDRHAVLQHIRKIVLQQRGQTWSQINDDVSLEDIPTALVGAIREAGFKPAESGSREVAAHA